MDSHVQAGVGRRPGGSDQQDHPGASTESLAELSGSAAEGVSWGPVGAVQGARPAGGRYLVTGAAGFIGSHVCEALLARGDSVVGLDNFDDGYDLAVKVRNIQTASRHPAYRLVAGDIRDGQLLDEVFAEGTFDAIVHLAARAGVRPSIRLPALYDAVNVAGTTMLLHRAATFGVGRIVLASSSSVYGARSVPPFREDGGSADQPSSPYAATKRANEIGAYAFHHLYGASVTCLRFFTVYGPRQRPEMAIHKFTRMIDSGEPVTLFGDGSSSRDYTFIADIVSGVLAAVDRPNGYRIYNLGTTATIELSCLVRKIGDLLGRVPDIVHLPIQDGDVPTTHADISLARAELGYDPRTPLDDGLAVFVAWYLDNRTEPALPAELAPLSRLRIRQVLDLADDPARTVTGRAS